MVLSVGGLPGSGQQTPPPGIRVHRPAQKARQVIAIVQNTRLRGCSFLVLYLKSLHHHVGALTSSH